MGAPARPARPVTVPLASALPADEDAPTQEPPDAEQTLDEETPTQRGARELARRLAEEVQRRVAAPLRPFTEPLEPPSGEDVGDGPVTEKVNLDELVGPPTSAPPRSPRPPPSLRPVPLSASTPPVAAAVTPPSSSPRPDPVRIAESVRTDPPRAEPARIPAALPVVPRPEAIRDGVDRVATNLPNREPVARPRVPPKPQEDPVRPDDPRELARRLAEEAKRRLSPPALEAPADEPEPTSWESRRGAFEAVPDPGPAPYESDPVSDTPEPTDDTLGGPPAAWTSAFGIGEEPTPEADDPDPEPPPDLPTQFARGRSLAERAAPVQAAPQRMSAAEALAAARLAEAEAEAQRSRAARPAPASRAAAAAPASRPASLAPASLPPAVPRPAAAPAGRGADPAAVFAEVFPQARVEQPVPVTQIEVFRALWRAHRARALHDGALELVGTSSVLLAAVDQGTRVAAARVTVGGATWAAWVDLDRRLLLGAARPAEVYLAGL